MKKSYAGVIVTFVVFALLFNTLFSGNVSVVEEQSLEKATADTMMAQEADPAMAMRAEVFEDQEVEQKSAKPLITGLLGILLLSFVCTMLSWTVAEEVVRKRKVMLVDFKDAKGKKVMQALANKTCQEIMELLSRKKMTASEIAEKVGMSLPRIHYNIKLLLAAELIEAKEFNYSEKGKEMDIYSLTRTHFMIGPEESK